MNKLESYLATIANYYTQCAVRQYTVGHPSDSLDKNCDPNEALFL